MSTNAELFERAKLAIPGGVNSPVRAFGSVGGTPSFLVRAKGAYVTDAEGRGQVDEVATLRIRHIGALGAPQERGRAPPRPAGRERP